jgi:hypothetical protein
VETVVTESADEVRKLLIDNKFDFYIVNCSLPRFAVGRDDLVMVIADSTIQNVFSIARYNPKVVLFSPFQNAELSFAFMRLLNQISGLQRFPARLMDINNLINSFVGNLSLLQRDNKNKQNLKENFIDFCKEDCSLAVRGEQYDDKKHAKFSLIHPFSKSGNVYCDQRETCLGYKFIDWLESQAIEVERPLDKMQRPIGDGISTFMDIVANLSKEYWEDINKLYKLKRSFCEKSCEHLKSDSNFKKGDIIFSEKIDLRDIKVSYCDMPSCALENFLNIFTHKVL